MLKNHGPAESIYICLDRLKISEERWRARGDVDVLVPADRVASGVRDHSHDHWRRLSLE